MESLWNGRGILGKGQDTVRESGAWDPVSEGEVVVWTVGREAGRGQITGMLQTSKGLWISFYE